MAIKYRESDKEKLLRVVKNFNAKITRAQARGYTALPERVAVRDLTKDIGSRADFNRTVNMIQRFSKKGAEAETRFFTNDPTLSPPQRKRLNADAITITKWEKTELNRQRAIINLKRQRELARVASLEVYSQGKPLEMKRGEMGNRLLKKFQGKPVNPVIRSRSELEGYKRQLSRQMQKGYFSQMDQMYKDNYIKALRNVYGDKAGGLIAHLQGMSPRQIVDMRYANTEGDITFTYDELEANAKLFVLYDVWKYEGNPSDLDNDYIDEGLE